jgi:hypothetical protein
VGRGLLYGFRGGPTLGRRDISAVQLTTPVSKPSTYLYGWRIPGYAARCNAVGEYGAGEVVDHAAPEPLVTIPRGAGWSRSANCAGFRRLRDSGGLVLTSKLSDMYRSSPPLQRSPRVRRALRPAQRARLSGTGQSGNVAGKGDLGGSKTEPATRFVTLKPLTRPGTARSRPRAQGQASPSCALRSVVGARNEQAFDRTTGDRRSREPATSARWPVAVSVMTTNSSAARNYGVGPNDCALK